MKFNRKISTRERWVLTFAPTVALAAIYFYGFAGDFSASFEKEKKHLADVSARLPPPATPPALVKARAALDDTRRSIVDRQNTMNEVQAHIATLPKSVAAILDDRNRARVIERVESIFARNGIIPMISESAGEGSAPEQALLAVLSPKIDSDSSNGKPLPKVWHCIFDDTTPRFSRALAAVCREAPPTVVPLTLNLVYNPGDNGQSRLLEFWLLY